MEGRGGRVKGGAQDAHAPSFSYRTVRRTGKYLNHSNLTLGRDTHTTSPTHSSDSCTRPDEREKTHVARGQLNTALRLDDLRDILTARNGCEY